MAITPWGTVASLAENVIDKIWPSPEDKSKRDEAKAKLIEAQQKGELKQLENDFELAKAQIEVNKTEAASDHWFVASWRPAIGWSCAIIFLSSMFLIPLARFVLAAFGIIVDLPQPDMSQMMPVLLGMLGLGGMRSYDKKNGTSKVRD